MIYQGFKPSTFYWEFINTARKVLILSINVFLSTFSLYYRVLPILVLLLVFFRLQIRLQPYKLPLNNVLERAEVIAGTFTLYGGLLYIGKFDFALFNVIVFAIIILVNIYFVVFWLNCMLATFQDKHRYVLFWVHGYYRNIKLIVKLLTVVLRIKDGPQDTKPKTPILRKSRRK